jgi:integrase
MTRITQPIDEVINFDDAFTHCFDNLIMARSFKKSTINSVILAMSLATGLEMRYVFRIKWKELLTLGTENNAIVKNELKVRKYFIPIHPKLKFLLSELYCKLDYPNINEEIINSIPKVIINTTNLPEWIIRCSGENTVNEIQKVDSGYLKEFNFDNYSQILFGRKVFEVNGYTNDISKFLKMHFKLRSNKELFDFLGYESKDEIKYRLSNINLDAVGAFITLEDKNFQDSYPFQKFTAFSKFLQSEILAYRKPVTNSIRLLLLISLYNGIRPSKLLRLKWHDIIQIDEEEKSIQIKNHFIFEHQEIKIYKEFGERILNHFIFASERACDIRFYNKSRKKRYTSKPNLDGPVFVTNKDNPLTQPSLSREIKKALEYLSFPHAEKLNSNSTLIMYGRRIMEIKGDHKPTIQKLKEHFNFKSKKELFEFLYLTGSREKDKEIYNFKGKVRKNIFEGILYDF